MEEAIEEGYNVIVMPGYAFAQAIYDVAPLYPDIKFVALDVSEGDLTAYGEREFDGPNVFSAVYQEEIAGYMAGYAAVKLGYTKLGFLGGMAVPAVQRYGHGFVQGADAAAGEVADVPAQWCQGETRRAGRSPLCGRSAMEGESHHQDADGYSASVV